MNATSHQHRHSPNEKNHKCPQQTCPVRWLRQHIDPRLRPSKPSSHLPPSEPTTRNTRPSPNAKTSNDTTAPNKAAQDVNFEAENEEQERCLHTHEL